MAHQENLIFVIYTVCRIDFNCQRKAGYNQGQGSNTYPATSFFNTNFSSVSVILFGIAIPLLHLSRHLKMTDTMSESTLADIYSTAIPIYLKRQ